MPNPLRANARALIIANYNASAPPQYQINDESFEFDTPLVNTNVSFAQNTELLVRPTAASGNYGQVKMYYNRINLSGLTTHADMDWTQNPSEAQIVDYLNQEYGIYLASDDYTLAGTGETTVFTAKPESLLFIGALAAKAPAQAPGPVGDPVQYRHYKFRVLNSDDITQVYTAVSEINAMNGTEIVPVIGKTYFVTPNVQWGTADTAFNGVDEDYLGTHQSYGNTEIGIDFGAITPITEFGIKAAGFDLGADSLAWHDFDILGSNNGIDYDTLKAVRNASTWAINEKRDFAVSDLTAAQITQDSMSLATAKNLGLNGQDSLSGVGVRWYKFTVAEPTEVVLDTELSSSVDTHIALFGSAGQLLYQDDNTGAGTTSLMMKTLAAGTYYAAIGRSALAYAANYNAMGEALALSLDGVVVRTRSSVISAGATPNSNTAQALSQGIAVNEQKRLIGTGLRWFNFTLASASSVIIDAELSDTEMQTRLALYGADGNVIATDFNTSAIDKAVISTWLDVGTYYILAGEKSFTATSNFTGTPTGSIDSSGVVVRYRATAAALAPAVLLDDNFYRVSLLLKNNATDKSNSALTMTRVNEVSVDLTGGKWGDGCMSFDGTGGYTHTPDTTALGFGTGDFTVEGMFFFRDITKTDYLFTTKIITPFTLIQVVNGLVSAYNGGTGDGVITIAAYQWYHIAYSRTAGVGTLFIDGQVAGTGANTQNYGTANQIFVGGNPEAGPPSFDGKAHDVRVTKGWGRYKAAFTPPTAPFPRGGAQTPVPMTMPGIRGWYDASDASTLTLVSGKISRWDDKTGAGRVATQTNAALRFTVEANKFNGLSTVKGVGASMGFTAQTLAANSSWAFVVASASTANTLLFGGATRVVLQLNANRVRTTANTNGVEYLMNAPGANDGGHHLIGVTSSAVAGNSLMIYDGAKQVIAAQGSASINSMGRTDTSQWMNGNIGEAIFGTGALTMAQIDSMIAYLKEKWGTPA